MDHVTRFGVIARVGYVEDLIFLMLTLLLFVKLSNFLNSIFDVGNAYLLWQGPVANGSSYTYDEAMDRCASDGGELATETQLLEKMNSDVSAGGFNTLRF